MVGPSPFPAVRMGPHGSYRTNQGSLSGLPDWPILSVRAQPRAESWHGAFPSAHRSEYQPREISTVTTEPQKAKEGLAGRIRCRSARHRVPCAHVDPFCRPCPQFKRPVHEAWGLSDGPLPRLYVATRYRRASSSQSDTRGNVALAHGAAFSLRFAASDRARAAATLESKPCEQARQRNRASTIPNLTERGRSRGQTPRHSDVPRVTGRSVRIALAGLCSATVGL